MRWTPKVKKAVTTVVVSAGDKRRHFSDLKKLEEVENKIMPLKKRMQLLGKHNAAFHDGHACVQAQAYLGIRK